MTIFTAMRGFAEGLGRGLALYFSERNDFTAGTIAPGLRKTGPR
jgi:hypothetical protein